MNNNYLIKITYIIENYIILDKSIKCISNIYFCILYNNIYIYQYYII